MKAGLRIDVDTLRGTRLGVPRLLSLLERFGFQATFFFSVGPDNMGRHLWRLFKPAFFYKMLRTRAPSLYGIGILRCGVIGRGPDIGRRCSMDMRRVVREGHEAGLHAWDHQRWQSMDMDFMDAAVASRELELGCARFTDIFGAPPLCSAAPAWRVSRAILAMKASFPFLYNSDCRGDACFLPDVARGFIQPQIPVTLPTYDEMLGRDGVNDGNYNARLLDLFRPGKLNVLCIHAEVEGIAKAGLFEHFLVGARERGISFCRLDEMVRLQGEMPMAELEIGTVPGREGRLCRQGKWTVAG